MGRVILLCAVFLSSANLFAQQQEAFASIDSLISAANYDEALAQIELKSKKNLSADETAILQNKKAELFITRGKLEEAELILGNISPTNSHLRAVTLSTTGFLNLKKGRYDLAYENLQAALTDFQSAGKENTKEAVRCLANMASYFLATGKYNKAEEYETIALHLRQKLYGESSEEVAASYNNLGLIYLQSDPDRSLEYYEKALATYQKLHAGDHPKIAIANTNIGVNYNQLELYGDAINYFETAKKIWEKIYPNGHPNLAIVLQNLGNSYARQKNNKAAIEYYEKAIAIYTKSFGQKHPDIAAALNGLGNLKLNENKYDEAIQVFQRSLIANAPQFNDPTISRNPIGTDYYNPTVLVFTLSLKAKALEMKYLGKTLKLSDLKLALQCTYKCDSLIDDIRHQSTDDQDKLALGTLATDVYEVGVRLSHTISENVLHPRTYREQMFYFAEKSKSSVLQESIADAQAKSFAGIPPTLLDQEKYLKSTIALYSQKLSQKPEAEEEKKLRTQLFKLNNEYNTFVKKLEKEFPNYFNLKFSPNITSVSDIQNSIRDRTAVVSYFLTEKTNQLYQFTITRQGFAVKNSTVPPEFNRYLKGFTNSILFSDFETYKKSAQPISVLLKPNVNRKINQLVVIPTGRLGTIPFEALPLGKIDATGFNGVHYYIERFAISYEFAANLFVQKSKTKATENTGSIFLCAPVKFPERDLNELPGTEKEINTIAKLFEKSKTVRLEEANETIVKSAEISNYNYLHFATHGIVDESNPESSRIFLRSSPTDDGNLYAGEIYNLTLHANLAVLSACQTGLGKISKGEGVIGLSRALVYAGAKNIIVSFWSVADESTSELMTDFYSFLQSTKATQFSPSLQQAKLKMIKDTRYNTPYYWAPFILIGQ